MNETISYSIAFWWIFSIFIATIMGYIMGLPNGPTYSNTSTGDMIVNHAKEEEED